ncbi:MAG: ABC transporter substrate-binding protein [Rhodospirillaceae bacterium]|nr:ABC transporter substrate-binding protein [Rhodospirillaceae bacterium]
MFERLTILAAAMATAASLAVPPASAEDLTIALASEATSIDPHFHNTGNNNQIVFHIFDTLIKQGSSQELEPGLATSWGPIDDTTWEFHLREGVTFHDGSPFTADDVVFTLERAPNVPDSPSSFAGSINSITEVIVVDDYTIQFKTAAAYPLMPNDLSVVRIISRENGEGATTADYNSGAAAIGTGPYKLVEYVPGDRIVLTANDDYWDGRPEWDNVTFRPITSDPARVAALLAGDVDVIASVPTADIAQLADNPDVVLSQGVSNRVIYLHIDSAREVSPMVTAKDGSEIPNPFRDVRVRRAISMAIDRNAIVEQVMEGVAIPAGQLLPDGFFGVSENIEVPTYDPDGARALLEEAGYPDGFAVTIAGPNDRYINDEQIVQAIAQMLARVGIDASVETMPRSVYFGRATGGENGSEFSLMLVGWGSDTGEASSPLRALLATKNPELGWGSTNRGGYSSAEMDAALTEAMQTVDDTRRAELLARACEIAMGDVGLIPTHFQVNTWATRPGLAYIPRTDEYTLAMNVVRSE